MTPSQKYRKYLSSLDNDELITELLMQHSFWVRMCEEGNKEEAIISKQKYVTIRQEINDKLDSGDDCYYDLKDLQERMD